MKLLAVITLIGMTATPALAGGPAIGSLHRHGRHRTVHYEEYCYKNVEKYIPGYYNKHGQWVGGYVDSERKRVPCGRRYIPQTTPHYHYEEEHPNMGNVDNNSCVEGTVAGGLLGGALGGVLSKKDNWIWAIPTGIVSGAMVGCQVDGG